MPYTPLKPSTYTIREAADRLNISQDTVRRLIKRGLLRRSLALRKILIPVEDVETFMGRTGAVENPASQFKQEVPDQLKART